MKKLTAITIIFLMVLPFIYCSQGEQKVTLRFKYEPGQVLTYKQATTKETKVFKGDSTIDKGSHHYDMVVEQNVVGIDADGVAELIEKDSWSYVMQNKEDSTKLDTVTHERELNLHVAPSGKVVKVGFISDTDEALISYLKNYFEQAWPEFPQGELPIGYNWTQTAKVVMPDETLEASTTYEIKSMVREAGYDCAVIDYKGNMVIPVLPREKKSTIISGIDRIASEGVIYFAYKEGFVVLQRENWTIDGERLEKSEGKEVEYRLAVEVISDYVLASVVKK